MIDRIKQSITEAFDQYEAAFSEALDSDNELLRNVLKYVGSTKGKGLRPILTLLAAAVFGPVSKDAIASAVSLELLHTASLMHDDVVDQTYQRRSKYSVNALWNNRIAILVGDYYLSKSALVSSSISDRRVTTMLSQLGCDLSDGELLQVSNEQKLTIDEPAYLDVIRKKTAKTFAFCTQAGAIAAGASTDQEQHLRLFGEYLGMIFQIKDDIFDYFESDEIGKPTGNDLKEGKMTLPLIFALEHSTKEERRPFLNMIRNRDYTVENLLEMSRFVQRIGGISYAQKRMKDFHCLATEILQNFPESPARTSLLDCLDYAMNREK